MNETLIFFKMIHFIFNTIIPESFLWVEAPLKLIFGYSVKLCCCIFFYTILLLKWILQWIFTPYSYSNEFYNEFLHHTLTQMNFTMNFYTILLLKWILQWIFTPYSYSNEFYNEFLHHTLTQMNFTMNFYTILLLKWILQWIFTPYSYSNEFYNEFLHHALTQMNFQLSKQKNQIGKYGGWCTFFIKNWWLEDTDK